MLIYLYNTDFFEIVSKKYEWNKDKFAIKRWQGVVYNIDISTFGRAFYEETSSWGMNGLEIVIVRP